MRARPRPNLEWRRKRLYAVLEIPRDLRRQLRRPRFIQTLETDSVAVAERRAAPLLARWRAAIAAARGQPHDDAAFFRQALQAAHGDAERRVIERQAWDTAWLQWGRAPGVDDFGQPPGDDPDAAAFYRSATAVPFDAHAAEWLATPGLAPRTRQWQAAVLARFTLAFPTLDSATRAAVRKWVAGLVTEQGLAPATVRQMLAAIRSYWRHCQQIEAVPEGLEPFAGLTLRGKGGRAQRDDRRQAFTTNQVVMLLQEAAGDATLTALIEVGRWTGCRIEEACSLKVQDVHLDAPIPHLSIVAGKSSAAIRDIPIHAALRPVLARLMGDRREGYILTGLAATKHGGRSNALGKRFSKLKASMGLGAGLTFHSLRHTVATLLKDASVPEATAADILGHTIPRLTFGTYGHSVSLATKAAAVALLSYPEQ